MNRRFLLLGAALVLLVSLVSLFLLRKSPAPSLHLTFAAVKLYHSANFPSVALLHMTNVSSRSLEVFPMYSVETKVDDENPFRSEALNLGRKWKPGEFRTVRVVLRNVSGRTWRVGVWYTEVQPRWKQTIQSWLAKIGWDKRQSKVPQYSDWFDVNSIPAMTNKPGDSPSREQGSLLGWEVGPANPPSGPELPAKPAPLHAEP